MQRNIILILSCVPASMMLIYVLLICFAAETYDSTIVNVYPGIYNIKAESDDLQLPMAGQLQHLQLQYIKTGGRERVVIAMYHMSIYSSSNQWFVTMNNQQLPSTSMISGCGPYLSNHGLLMKGISKGNYYFSVTYCRLYKSYFEDCRSNHDSNIKLFTM